VWDTDLLERLIKLSHVEPASLIHRIGHPLWSALSLAFINHPGGELVQGYGGQGVSITIDAHHDGVLLWFLTY
jgi:hypothetical protein